MKVVYLNDEQKSIKVRINDLDFTNALNSGGDISRFYLVMKSCEMKVFNLKVPSGAIPYIKKWQDVVMISYIDPSGLTQFEQWPPHQDAS